MIKGVYAKIFDDCYYKPLLVTTLEAEDELAMREYLQFPHRRLALAQN